MPVIPLSGRIRPWYWTYHLAGSNQNANGSRRVWVKRQTPGIFWDFIFHGIKKSSRMFVRRRLHHYIFLRSSCVSYVNVLQFLNHVLFPNPSMFFTKTSLSLHLHFKRLRMLYLQWVLFTFQISIYLHQLALLDLWYNHAFHYPSSSATKIIHFTSKLC